MEKLTQEQMDMMEGLIFSTSLESVLGGIGSLCFKQARDLKDIEPDNHFTETWNADAVIILNAMTKVRN